MAKKATLTIQQWGNSLAVRIPAAIGRSAHFEAGQEVEVTTDEIGVTVKPVGPRKVTLVEKLAKFDPACTAVKQWPRGVSAWRNFDGSCFVGAGSTRHYLD